MILEDRKKYLKIISFFFSSFLCLFFLTSYCPSPVIHQAILLFFSFSISNPIIGEDGYEQESVISHITIGNEEEIHRIPCPVG